MPKYAFYPLVYRGEPLADSFARLAAAGYDAVLVGERLVRSPDRSAAIRHLTSASRSARTSCG